MTTKDTGRRQALLERFEKTTEPLLILLAVAFIPVLVVPLSVELSPGWEQIFLGLEWLIWAVFAIDLGVRVSLTEHRIAYLRRHWLDVLIVALPMLRPLRATRLIGLLRAFQMGVFLSRAAVGARRVLNVPQIVSGGIGLTFLIATLVFLAERDGGGPIDSFAAALWWAFVTVTTVGYGDAFPVTATGRVLTVLLMVGGVALFSALAATLASFLIRGNQEASEEEIEALDKKMERWRRADTERLRSMEQKLDRVEALLRDQIPLDEEKQG